VGQAGIEPATEGL